MSKEDFLATLFNVRLDMAALVIKLEDELEALAAHRVYPLIRKVSSPQEHKAEILAELKTVKTKLIIANITYLDLCA